MRGILVALIVSLPLLAGCVQPDAKNPYEEIPITCPTWHATKNSHRYTANFVWNETIDNNVNMEKEDVAGSGLETNRSRPLDKFMVSLERIAVHDGVLKGKVYAGESSRQLLWRDPADPKDAGLRELVFEPGNHTGRFAVVLTASGDPPAPAPLRIVWTFEPNLDGDSSNTSIAVVEHLVNFWYRDLECV